MMYKFNSMYNFHFYSNAPFFPISRSLKPRYFSFGKVKNRHVCNYSSVVDSNNQTDSFIPLDSNYRANYPSLESNKSDPTLNASDKRPNFSSKFVSSLLNSFNHPNNIIINNEESQRTISKLTLYYIDVMKGV